MAVNTNIYGTPEQWVDTYYQQTELTNKNKKAWFGGNTAQTQLRGGVASGKLSYSEPLDYSLVYCGFGTESALSHCTYLGRDPENVNDCKIISTQDFEVSNYFFSEKTSQYGYSNDPVTQVTYIDTENLNRYAWGANPDLVWNVFPYLEPLTVLNPHNVVFQVNVRCSSSLTGECTSMGLGRYMQDHNTYPYIQYVYINPYWGNLSVTQDRSFLAGRGNVPRGGSTLTLQRLDNYTIPSENVDTQLAIQGTRGIIVMGSYGADRIDTFAHAYTPFYTTEQGKPHIKLSGSYARIEYYDDVIEDILKTVACFGLYFTIEEGAIPTMSLTDSRMYIGLIDEDGIGRGRYLQGAQTVNAPQAANDFQDMHTIIYNPQNIDPTHYQNDTQFYDATLANGFTRFWVLNAAGVSAVLNQMYSIMNEADPDEPIERYSQKVFLTNNPIDCIISLKKFPLDNVPTLSGAYFVNFGAKATNILAYPLAKACGVYSFTFSSANDTSLYPHFDNSFLDYEPYTKCELVIPFCGSVDIPCCYLYEYGGIEVKLVIDFISGACTAYVLANGITITSVSGNCAIDLPVSGIQSATLDSQIFSAAQAKKQNFTKTRAGLVASALTATAGAVTGNPLMIVAGAAGVLATAMSGNETRKSLDYELQHLQTPYKEVSSASGQIAQTYDMRCKMIVTRPKLLTGFTESAYAETVGYSCLYTGEVENFHGFTVGSIELAGVPCTAEEKAYIESMFASGVHLPEVYP